MDWLTISIRIIITLTFLLLAAGGPYALIQLRNFIQRYTVAHEALEQRVQTLERSHTAHEEPTK